MKLDRKGINLTDLFKKELLWENCQLRSTDNVFSYSPGQMGASNNKPMEDLTKVLIVFLSISFKIITMSTDHILMRLITSVVSHKDPIK